MYYLADFFNSFLNTFLAFFLHLPQPLVIFVSCFRSLKEVAPSLMASFISFFVTLRQEQIILLIIILMKVYYIFWQLILDPAFIFFLNHCRTVPFYESDLWHFFPLHLVLLQTSLKTALHENPLQNKRHHKLH